jgi:flagellar biosynthesis/type III secretory pathway protein FliH
MLDRLKFFNNRSKRTNMKAQKAISVLATLSILSFAVACNDGGGSTVDRYAEGFAAGKAEGYKDGYDKGYTDGDKDGYARAEAYFKTADYSKGFNDGKTVGVALGYTQGYSVGKADGKAFGYDQGYDDGELDGKALGYTSGKAVGYDIGYDDGNADGYDSGYDDGLDDGYDLGYEDGYAGLSVGQTPKMHGYADVISAFHNELIDYSKIKAPKETKRGLVANGKLLFSEASLTNKDTLKKAAIVEQYLVVEMSKQVQSKFGLSAGRSLQIAKAANHFRKYSTTRALTAEDTNAYASEIIGTNFKAVGKAFESSLKGDLSSLNSVIDVAAVKNGVSPEKMSQIVTELFL